MNHLDGNALAGPLVELFQVDMTMATGRCVSCRQPELLARASVYISAMGSVMRCRNCDSVLAVLVEIEGVQTLSLAGVTVVGSPQA